MVSGQDADARALALRLGLKQSSLDTRLRDLPATQLLLVREEGRLCLRRGGAAGPGPVFVDFDSPAMRHRRRGGQNELVGRAVGVSKRRRPAVLDATAGLGRDAFVMADLGCSVLMCERNPVMQVLLEDGLRAAGESAGQPVQEVLGRMELQLGDARECAAETLSTIDVIYLDPMFPGRDKSAAVKKDLAIMQLLLGEPAPEEAKELLAWALQQPVNRVVVKRPPRAASLPGATVSHQVSGKAVRYDVYMLNHKSLD